MNRTYIFERKKHGVRDRTILEKAPGDDGGQRETAALSLPPDLPGEVYGEVLDAIRDAYQNGREDRSAELIPGEPKADLLRSMVSGTAMEVMRAYIGRWLLATDVVQYRISLDRCDEAARVLTVSIGTEHTFPLARYDLRLLVERKGRR